LGRGQESLRPLPTESSSEHIESRGPHPRPMQIVRPSSGKQQRPVDSSPPRDREEGARNRRP
jgi:hypothetical protein